MTNEIIFYAVTVTGEMLRLYSLTIYHTISDTTGKSINKMSGREPACSLRLPHSPAKCHFQTAENISLRHVEKCICSPDCSW